MSHVLRQSPEPPDQDQRLAELLDACLRAERGAPGSAAEILRQAPEELRDELDQLLAMARALATTEWPAPSSEFRAGARARFETAAQPAPPATRPLLNRARVGRWLVGLAAGLALMAVGGFGGVLASAGAVPGDPLYAVKQADEAITLGLTRDDLARSLVLLRQAGARLDEARRLIAAGRVEMAGDLLQLYSATLERAGSSLNRATAADPRARAEFEAQLQQQLGQLQSLAREAPETLQPSIERAEAAANQQLGSGQSGGNAQSDAEATAPTPTPSPASAAVSPSPSQALNPSPSTAVSTSPAPSPSVRAPTQGSPSPSPASPPEGEDSPGK
jgi:Domain of unknown function (DUF5667)